MVRPLRVEFPGGLYHVIVRGNERKSVFAFITLTPQAKADPIFPSSGYHPQVFYEHFRINDRSGTGGTCTPWRPDPCDKLDQCLSSGTKQYPIERYSYVLANLGIGSGRNSNTFTKCLSGKCGIYVHPGVHQRASGWYQPCPGGF